MRRFSEKSKKSPCKVGKFMLQCIQPKRFRKTTTPVDKKGNVMMSVLEKGILITDPQYNSIQFNHPWAQGLSFTSKDCVLPARNDVSTFMKEFEVKKPLRRALLRATALGVFDLALNGERVGETDEDGTVRYDELKPGWTDYRFRVFAFSYDVTSLCRERNLLSATVSAGWWSGRISFGAYGYPPTAFAAELVLEYEDGDREVIASGEDWLVTNKGPILTADLWDGEMYDARIPSPTPADAHNAVPFTAATCEIEAHVGEPIRVSKHLTRTPQSATLWKGVDDNDSDYGKIHVQEKRVGRGCESVTVKPGEGLILDMGQNMVGRPAFTLSAPEGTRIECFFAEMLNDSGKVSRGNDGPEGSLYIKNYRSALSRLVYFASGKEKESFTPLHTFFGFRYLEFTADREITIHAVQGEVVRSDLKETSTFSCSNAEVNKLYENVLWGQRGNYLSVPTDCPQRDERLGWTGDTQIFCGAGSYNADVRGFFKKWLGDARHSQIGENGAYCDVIPRVFHKHNNGNAAWGDACLIVPDRLYQMYGDTDTMSEHYASMEEYMNYLTAFGMNGPNIAYGDWLNYEVTDRRYIAVCYYAEDARLMAKFSRILADKHADRRDFFLARAEHYEALRKEILAHFAKEYVTDGGLTLKTQTAYLLALKFDLLPAEMRERAKAELQQKLVDNDYTLSTGFVGTGILCQTLQASGLSDLAFSLLLQTKDPSWLYSIRQGATTIWERWNSYTLARGFGDVNMNSFNHYAYGAVVEWMIGGMCGILPDPEAPGFSHFLLYPTPDTRTEESLPAGQSKITHASATYDAITGHIASAWYYRDGRFVYRCEIPEGTTAEIGLPLSAAKEERDTLLLNDVRFTGDELNAKVKGDRLCFTLSAGNYTVSFA